MSDEGLSRQADHDLARGSVPSALVYPALTLIVSAVSDFWGQYPDLVTGLFLLNLAAGAIRAHFARKLASGHCSSRPLHFSIWGVAAAWSAFSTTAIVLFGTDWTSQLTFVVTVGLTAGGISTLASRFDVFTGYAVIMNVPPILALLSWSTKESLSALVLVVFLAFAIATCRVQNRTYRESFRQGQALRQAKLELEQRNQRLQEANLAAEAAAIAKDEFLAVVSHELRTPMNGVLALAEELLASPLTDDQQKLAGTILTSSSSLVKIVNDLLDASSLEKGRFELHGEPFSPRRATESAVELFRAESLDRRLHLGLACDLAPELLLLGDPARFSQIVINLVGNAMKFTARGSVAVRLEWHEGLWLSVTDTGPGIAPGFAERVFEAFTQVDASSSRRHGGVGLGLYITAALVARMGGRLWFESQGHLGGHPPEGVVPSGLESGSRFSVFLPLPVADGLSSPEPGPTADFSDLRVLVAEDDEINQQVASRLLEGLGVRAELVSTGNEVLKRCAEQSYDVIFMDLQMPELDGLSATRRLREQGSTTWIVALTANARESDGRRCTEAGMNDFLAKPVRKGDFQAALARFAETAGNLRRERA